MFDMDPMRIMTPLEVADYLRMEEVAIRRLIAAGEIPSFEVAGEPRVQAGALVVWFQGQVQSKNLERLGRMLEDKRTWGEALRDEPALRQRILQENYEENTFGAFLKKAAEEVEHPAAAPSAPDQERAEGTSKAMHVGDFPELSFAVDQAFRQLELDKVEPWVFLTTGKMQPIETFYGKTIRYSGGAFEGSPRVVFWGGFIEPFLEAIFNRMFEAASSYSRERQADSREVVQHVKQRLLEGVSRIYRRMQDIDCRLRGKGDPRSVSPMDVSGRIREMEEKLRSYAESALRGLDGKEPLGPSGRAAYVNESRLQQLRSLQAAPFDLGRLIQLCEELNHAWASGSRLSVLMLLRTILNHVPPVFGQRTFAGVIGQVGEKSFKETMERLDSFLRKLADEVLHWPITKRVDIPNDQRVDFRAPLDRLLSEIYLILDAKK